jgi:hypothetical protein
MGKLIEEQVFPHVRPSQFLSVISVNDLKQEGETLQNNIQWEVV